MLITLEYYKFINQHVTIVDRNLPLSIVKVRIQNWAFIREGLFIEILLLGPRVYIVKILDPKTSSIYEKSCYYMHRTGSFVEQPPSTVVGRMIVAEADFEFAEAPPSVGPTVSMKAVHTEGLSAFVRLVSYHTYRYINP